MLVTSSSDSSVLAIKYGDVYIWRKLSVSFVLLNLFFRYHLLKLHNLLLPKPFLENWNFDKIYHKCVEVIIQVVTKIKKVPLGSGARGSV